MGWYYEVVGKTMPNCIHGNRRQGNLDISISCFTKLKPRFYNKAFWNQSVILNENGEEQLREKPTENFILHLKIQDKCNYLWHYYDGLLMFIFTNSRFITFTGNGAKDKIRILLDNWKS